MNNADEGKIKNTVTNAKKGNTPSHVQENFSRAVRGKVITWG